MSTSQRRWRPKGATLVVDSSDEEEAEQQQPSLPKPSRRRAAGLTLEASQQQQQQQQPAASQSSRDAMASLLDGSQPATRRAGMARGAAAPAAATPKASKKSGPSAKSAVGAAAAPAAAAAAAVEPLPVQACTTSTHSSSLWVDKHAPQTEADLVVHKKKVQEVREWLEQQQATLGQPGVPRVLVVSGPPGCGKSAVLHVLASALGFELCEWQPPVPLLYHEYQYQRSAGLLTYASKLDAFDEFVLRSKLPALSLQRSAGGGGKAGKAVEYQQQRQQPSQQRGGVHTATAAAGKAHGTLPRGVVAGAGAGAAAAATATATAAGPAGPAAASRSRPKLVVLDDLPHAAGPAERERLAASLGDLARTSRSPLVICATETSGKAQQERGLNAAAGTFQGLHKGLIAVLEGAQAISISFNPITALNTAKALRAVLEREHLSLPQPELTAIAEQANGDLHNALNTLQFVCTGQRPAPAPAAGSKRGRGTKRKAAGAATGAKGEAEAAAAAAAESHVAFAGRDSMLSLFHALGKLLYNKRMTAAEAVAAEAAGGGGPGRAGSEEPATSSRQASQQPPSEQQQQQQQQQQWTANGFWQHSRGAADAQQQQQQQQQRQQRQLPAVAGWCQRAPMQFDPEAVLAGASLDAGTVAAFLHENLPHFVAETAVSDMDDCLSYLSAADCIASSTRWGGGESMLVDDDMPASTMADAVAASTAARGICFSNCHPAPRRWLPLKSPALFTVHKAAAANREQLRAGVAPAWALHGGTCSLEPASRLAVELLPYARCIHARRADPGLQALQPARWSRVWEGQVYEQGAAAATGVPAAAGASAAPAGGEVLDDQGLGAQQQLQQQGEEDVIEPDSADEDDW